MWPGSSGVIMEYIAHFKKSRENRSNSYYRFRLQSAAVPVQPVLRALYKKKKVELNESKSNENHSLKYQLSVLKHYLST